MSRGGFRSGAGRPKGSKNKSTQTGSDQKPAGKATEEVNPPDEVLGPLTYMLKVMNDPKENAAVRRQMAVAAAPYCHPRKGEGAGKKFEKNEKAKQAGDGRFAAGKPPAKILPFLKGTDEL